MAYFYKWKPNKSAKREFAVKMKEIDNFCHEHGISKSISSDSYYFTLDGKNYRVSNHTIESSNRHAFNEFGEQIRQVYHSAGRLDNTVYITAGKTRIIDIYNDLAAGHTLDCRGYRVK